MGYLDKRGAIGTDKYLKIIEYLNEVNRRMAPYRRGGDVKIQK